MSLKRKQVRLSTLDAHIPEDHEVVFRIFEIVGSRPVTYGDYTDITKAQAASDHLCDVGRRHQFSTHWRHKVTHVWAKKWKTMNAGKRRHFKVSVPFSPEWSDERIKLMLLGAMAEFGPPVYRGNVHVTIDGPANKAEHDEKPTEGLTEVMATARKTAL